jgi:hypothetical protein
MTKMAYLAIIGELNGENTAISLRSKVVETCIQDLTHETETTIGWPSYLEKAAELVLETSAQENTIVLLLRHSSEEVVMKTLTWINALPSEDIFTKTIRDAIWELIDQTKWDGACSLALQAMSNAKDGETRVTLVRCIDGYRESYNLPIKDGWITIAGYAARMVRSRLIF